MNNCEIKDGKITAVEWTAVFPSLKLLKAVPEALAPKKLLMAGVAAGAWELAREPRHERGFPQWFPCIPDFFRFNPPGGILWAIAMGAVLWCAAVGISRATAVRVATGRSASWRELAEVFKARASTIVALPWALITVVLATIGLLHGLGKLSAEAVFLVAVLWIAFSMMVTWAGALLVPAVTVEGNDGFDAPGRAVSYAVGRAWYLLVCLVTLAGIGWIVSQIFFHLFDRAESVTRQASDEWGFSAFGVASVCIFTYFFSFLITGLTRIYLLIRESADGVPETELWMPEDDKKKDEKAAPAESTK